MNNETTETGEKMIAGEVYLSMAATAKFLGCGQTVLKEMMRKSRLGTLRPSLEWFRHKPKSPVYFRKDFLKSWALQRSKMHQ